ncbi:putative secreted protein [Streptomyces rapamycinicus NRRL 5491]|nr:putative secreted protein [Streptomyces rapamycinicus NRRL 5491]
MGYDCSPHPRGWSQQVQQHHVVQGLLPAPAGMVPRPEGLRHQGQPAPRTRGDGPSGSTWSSVVEDCSPHPRGWSPRATATAWPTTCSPHPRGWSHRKQREGGNLELLPAPAGMVPRAGGHRGGTWPAPRTRGDGPRRPADPQREPRCSPHPRGWSRLGLWSDVACRLLPAPAGMVPISWVKPWLLPAAPRTRGDGPCLAMSMRSVGFCSPHPRGWSLRGAAAERGQSLLPAPAGMVLRASPRATTSRSAPRTRGDGPTTGAAAGGLGSCSPHPRGWSPPPPSDLSNYLLLPAPAGMVPAVACTWVPPLPAPRTRGDGPAYATWEDVLFDCSPHPRGWSLGRRPHRVRPVLLPAPAGMVPRKSTPAMSALTAPRTRVDGPCGHPVSGRRHVCSPPPAGMVPPMARTRRRVAVSRRRARQWVWAARGEICGWCESCSVWVEGKFHLGTACGKPGHTGRPAV